MIKEVIKENATLDNLKKVGIALAERLGILIISIFWGAAIGSMPFVVLVSWEVGPDSIIIYLIVVFSLAIIIGQIVSLFLKD